MERTISMVGRHLIRIKVLQILYAYHKEERPDFEVFYKELEFSLKKSYEQYLMFLDILAELRSYAELRITQIQDRKLKNEDEWRRLERFSNNRVLLQLENNPQFKSLITSMKISLMHYQPAFKEIFKTINDSEFYEEYIAQEDSYQADKQFVRTALINVIAETESLYDSFEEYSIFWNDDIDNSISMVDKTIKNFEEKKQDGGDLLPMFADNETHDFGYKLFTQAVKQWDEINQYIDRNLKNNYQNLTI